MLCLLTLQRLCVVDNSCSEHDFLHCLQTDMSLLARARSLLADFFLQQESDSRFKEALRLITSASVPNSISSA